MHATIVNEQRFKEQREMQSTFVRLAGRLVGEYSLNNGLVEFPLGESSLSAALTPDEVDMGLRDAFVAIAGEMAVAQAEGGSETELPESVRARLRSMYNDEGTYERVETRMVAEARSIVAGSKNLIASVASKLQAIPLEDMWSCWSQIAHEDQLVRQTLDELANARAYGAVASALVHHLHGNDEVQGIHLSGPGYGKGPDPGIRVVTDSDELDGVRGDVFNERERTVNETLRRTREHLTAAFAGALAAETLAREVPKTRSTTVEHIGYVVPWLSSVEDAMTEVERCYQTAAQFVEEEAELIRFVSTWLMHLRTLDRKTFIELVDFAEPDWLGQNQ